jgi:hypothetical protein
MSSATGSRGFGAAVGNGGCVDFTFDAGPGVVPCPCLAAGTAFDAGAGFAADGRFGAPV